MNVLRPVLFLALTTVAASAAVTVSPQELAQENEWVQRNLLTATNIPPFSFTYDGQSSATLLPLWNRVRTDTVLDTNRTQHVLAWTNNGLEVKCVAVEYSNYPVVEWTVYLKNIGPTNSPILQDIKGLNTSFHRGTGPEFILNGNKGDFTTEDSYEPYRVTLGPNTVKTCAPFYYSGKSSDGPDGWPYYNLQVPDGGVILAIGWPGQWESSFTRDAVEGLNIKAGQQLTRLSLQPGETIRTPLIAMLFWQGTNTVRAQNVWRHWYIDHTIPRVNGQSPAAISQIQVSGDDTSQVDGFFEQDINPDVCWRDAGGTYTWYPSSTGLFSGENTWLNTGEWEVDPVKYPVGFKPYSDWIRARGLKFLLWFEPERIGNTNSWLSKNHPEWILPKTNWTVGYILNEGHPGAFHWLTNHMDGLIKANGIDWYREDMNGDGPLTAWRGNDAANRQGITENFYVQNHLAYWDALVAMNPGLRIDSCASGGRRNDLETMRRAVPLTRSDFEFAYMPNVVDGNQCQTYGASSWLPFQGTGAYIYDPYSFRSFYLASFGMGGLSPGTTAAQKQAYNECKKLGPTIIYGDYYPLTPYSRSNNVWMAWQFDRPDIGEGHAQIFRRSNSPIASMSFKLQGLEPEKYYDLQDFDKGSLGWKSGGELLTNGLMFQLNPRDSAILYYKTAQGVTVSVTASNVSDPGSLAVRFTANGISAAGDPLAYSWTFGDGGVSTNQSPNHAYSSKGQYVARVTVSDGNGNTSSKAIVVTVGLSDPTRMMKIAFPGYQKAELLTDFPALVVLGPALATNGFSYSQTASPNGWDLLFMNADRTQVLSHEIEKWNTNGDSFIWVQVPQVVSNTYIWAFWGSTNVSGPAQNTTNGSVWGHGYAGVWHLSATSGTPYDSTANRIAGTVMTTYGMCTQGAAGKIGNGCAFAGGYISANAASLPPGSSPRTLSAWFKKSAAATLIPGKEIVGYGNNLGNGNRFSLWIGGNGAANALGVESAAFARTFPWTWDANWHHLVAVLPIGQTNLSGVKLYYDGVENASATGQGAINTAPDELCLAAIPGYHSADRSYDFDGILDEVRISTVDRSANWLWAEYATAASNAVFSGYDAVTSYAPPATATRLAISGNHTNVIISWPTNAAVGAVLQESPDLLAWTNSTAVLTVNGTNITATVEPNSDQKFHRLAK